MGLVDGIKSVIESLEGAVELATTLEDGAELISQKKIADVAVALRAELYPNVDEIKGVYRGVLDKKAELMGGLKDVQAADKKAKLMKEIEEKQAALAELE